MHYLSVCVETLKGGDEYYNLKNGRSFSTQSLSNKGGNIVSGTPEHCSLLACFHSW